MRVCLCVCKYVQYVCALVQILVLMGANTLLCCVCVCDEWQVQAIRMFWQLSVICCQQGRDGCLNSRVLCGYNDHTALPELPPLAWTLAAAPGGAEATVA